MTKAHYETALKWLGALSSVVTGAYMLYKLITEDIVAAISGVGNILFLLTMLCHIVYHAYTAFMAAYEAFPEPESNPPMPSGKKVRKIELLYCLLLFIFSTLLYIPLLLGTIVSEISIAWYLSLNLLPCLYVVTAFIYPAISPFFSTFFQIPLFIVSNMFSVIVLFSVFPHFWERNGVIYGTILSILSLVMMGAVTCVVPYQFSMWVLKKVFDKKES